MIEQVTATMRERGSPGAHLGVSSRNGRAQAFYTHLGFRELTRTGTPEDGCVYMGIALMTASLALFGGTPIRTQPFTAWPVFGPEEERRLLERPAKRAVGPARRPAGIRVRRAVCRDARMPSRHRGGQRHGGVEDRAARRRHPGRATRSSCLPTRSSRPRRRCIEANAIPVFADIDLHTFNLDPLPPSRRRSPRGRGRSSRCILPGNPPTWTRSGALAADRGILVLEDAAHAHGATYRDRPAGSLGHIAAFSFQSSKNLTAGEGGIITTNDDALAAACRSIHNCGRVPDGVWYEHHVVSGNYRLGEFQGAVLNAQLDRLEEQTATRDRNGRRLAARLAALPGLHPQRHPPECTRHSHHLFMLRIEAARIRRVARGGARRAAGRGHSVLGRLRLLAAGPAAVPQQGVRTVPVARAPRRGSTTARPTVPTAI